MDLNARIFDGEGGPAGRSVSDLPDRFYSTAVLHARKSPARFPLFASVDPEGRTEFTGGDRYALKAEWVMLESLAIGAAERGKWNQLFKVLTDEQTFVGLEFAAA